MKIEENVPLAKYSSWLVGGAAEFYTAPEKPAELADVLEWAADSGAKITVISGGTNILISDSGVSGLVLHMRKFSGIEQSEEGGRLKISAYAGTSKSQILKIFLKKNLAASHFLAGLPGDIGGGVAMNAGVGEAFKPREFCEITDWVEVMHFDTRQIHRIEADELQWSYRSCKGWQPGVIIRVGLSWPLDSDISVLQKVKAANKLRLSKQPLEWPSCGSVFRNPPGAKAGQLIDQCGLKGFRIGGALVSEKHGNFIINTGNATAQDIRGVINEVQARIFQKKGIRLQTEVVSIGRWQDEL